jgi:NAD(P)-dependent dehydrogenase (short-subunit alcohol dehydrogenase family)
MVELDSAELPIDTKKRTDMTMHMATDSQLDVPDLPRLGRLTGRTAIVTGGGSAGSMPGTGAAMCVLFASEGANVVVLDLDADRAEHTHQTIAELGGSSVVAVADITDPAQCRRASDLAVAEFGRIDVLVNNAAIAPGQQADTDELWQRIINTNLRSAKLMSDVAVPPIKEQGGGSIIMISSIAAWAGGSNIAYSAAKAGMGGLANALAFKHGRSGIRVNVIAPGHVAIPMGLGYPGWSPGLNTRAMRAEASLLGVEGTGWDVAYTALFLASDEARYVTGVTIPVDGGATAVMPIVMHPYFTIAASSDEHKG